jgi:3-isopropylmalate/(R)-2-methylmalate dehydratase small subunit
VTPRRIERIEGRGLPLRGHDIDTDRIIPARFLRAVRFEGLEAHLFEDDRAAWPAGQLAHPFDTPVYRGAEVLVVNGNFGCGSSREHAPQALYRWGIRAIVGESFSEIFFGNSVALGLPCVGVPPEAADWLQAAIERDPAGPLAVDLHAMTVTAGGRTLPAALPGPARDAFLSGAWDATGLLLDRFEDVEAVARRLPYVTTFS